MGAGQHTQILGPRPSPRRASSGDVIGRPEEDKWSFISLKHDKNNASRPAGHRFVAVACEEPPYFRK
ncbi:hypothetical protein PM082_015986 [Marasmius tenuissimus]|nr:hypothetical protein PM082_015986 [Marasmius tenuissimus]